MKKRKEAQLLLNDNRQMNKKEVILEASGIWAVVHEGKAISLVIEKEDNKSWRYPKTIFTAPAFANILARRLNKIFKTTMFTVIELQIANQIEDI